MNQFDANGICLKEHRALKHGCPESEWVAGQTVKVMFGSKLSMVQVCESPEAAQAYIKGRKARSAKWAKEYTDMGRPVPPQHNNWTYEVI